MSSVEVAAASQLGQLLSELRRASGLSQRETAVAAQVSPRHLRRLERGERRTRLSTLERLAGALAGPGTLDRGEHLLRVLLQAAGPALAPESEHRQRVENRRELRWRQREATYDSRTTAEVWAGFLVRHAREWVDANGRTQRAVKYVLTPHDGELRQVDESEIDDDVFAVFPLPRRFRTG